MRDINEALYTASVENNREKIFGHKSTYLASRRISAFVRSARERARAATGETWEEKRKGNRLVFDEDHTTAIFDALHEIAEADKAYGEELSHAAWHAEEIVFDLPHDEEQFRKHQVVVAELQLLNLQASSSSSSSPERH